MVSVLLLLVHLNLYLMGVVTNLSQIAKLQISSWYTSYSIAGTEAHLKSSSEIILWCLNKLLKESVEVEN